MFADPGECGVGIGLCESCECGGDGVFAHAAFGEEVRGFGEEGEGFGGVVVGEHHDGEADDVGSHFGTELWVLAEFVDEDFELLGIEVEHFVHDLEDFVLHAFVFGGAVFFPLFHFEGEAGEAGGEVFGFGLFFRGEGTGGALAGGGLAVIQQGCGVDAECAGLCEDALVFLAGVVEVSVGFLADPCGGEDDEGGEDEWGFHGRGLFTGGLGGAVGVVDEAGFDLGALFGI